MRATQNETKNNNQIDHQVKEQKYTYHHRFAFRQQRLWAFHNKLSAIKESIYFCKGIPLCGKKGRFWNLLRHETNPFPVNPWDCLSSNGISYCPRHRLEACA